MTIDLKQLSTTDLAKLIEEAGVEFAARGQNGSVHPPEGSFNFSYEQPFVMGVDASDGKVIARFHSSFYGWVNFKWSREAIEMMQKMAATCLARGVTPSSVNAAGVAGPAGGVH
jgi:hypothetical protein